MSQHFWLINRTAIRATKHQKEQVIAPLFTREFGVKVIVRANFNRERHIREVMEAQAQS